MRKSLKLPQWKLAKYFGVAEQTIARMEKGHTEINFASEALLRAMCIEQAEIQFDFTKWLTRFSHSASGDGK
jgi:DNA-binding XRE family transcriptional regulator